MSGEFFALLSDSSVLRHSTRGGGWDEAAFRSAVHQGFNDPGKLATTWFGLRSDMLLGDLKAPIATARLSGWLIGWELAATREYWHEAELRLIGERTLCHRYLDAVESLGGQARIVNSETATVAGLKSAWMQIGRTSFDT
jgi:2-dehydro-3-deoxygalactonokinase